MGIINNVGAGFKAFGNKFVSFDAQKLADQKFDDRVDAVKGKADALGQRIVNFLEKDVFGALKTPIKGISEFQIAKPQVDEDGEEIPLTTKEEVGNFHKNVMIKGDNVALKGGKVAFLAARNVLSPIQRGAKVLGFENTGAMIQNSVALVIQAIVRTVLFTLAQLAHLKTPLKALAYTILAAAAVIVPQVGMGILAVKQHNSNKRIDALSQQIKQQNRLLNKPFTTKVKEAVSNNKALTAAVVVAGLAAAVYTYGVPAFVSSAASTVASNAQVAGSKVAAGASSAVQFAKPYAFTALNKAKSLSGKVGLKSAIAAGAVTLATAAFALYKKGVPSFVKTGASTVASGAKAAANRVSMPSKKVAAAGLALALVSSIAYSYFFGVPAIVANASSAVANGASVAFNGAKAVGNGALEIGANALNGARHYIPMT